MTNFEKYKDKLVEIEGDFEIKFAVDKDTREVVKCDSHIECKDCIFFSRNCAESDKIQWLCEEYEPLILSNDELELIKILSKINGEEYKYIYKRDKYIFIFSSKPIINNINKYGVVLNSSDCLEMTGLKDLFSNITFEDGLYDIENKCFIKE